MNRVIEDDLQAIASDVYLMTHTTNPLLGSDTVTRALSAFYDASAAGRADSLFTVNRFQTRFYGEDGRAINHDPTVLVRTQDLEPWFEENSNLAQWAGHQERLAYYRGHREGRRVREMREHGGSA